jgi:hypothetical protein
LKNPINNNNNNNEKTNKLLSISISKETRKLKTLDTRSLSPESKKYLKDGRNNSRRIEAIY